MNDTNQHLLAKEKFDSLVNKYSDTTVAVEIDSTVAMVLARIYNTIQWNDNLIKPIYKDFISIYNSKYYYKVANILSIERWKGGYSYSKKHDLYIGGPPHANSQYHLVD